MNKKKETKEKVSLKSKVSKGVSPNRVKTLDDILGVKQFNPFGTNDIKELEAKLAIMNLADMHEFAVKVDLLPHHDKGIMKRRIIKAFKTFKSSHIGEREVKIIDDSIDFNSKRGQEVKRILNQGR